MALKLKFKSIFPAAVVAAVGLAITKASNVYTFTLDLFSLGQIASVPDSTTASVPVIQDNGNGTATYNRMAISDLLNAENTLGTIASQNYDNVSITGGTITGMPTPTTASDVVIKSYVDAFVSGLRILASCNLATAAVLPNSPTYGNGASGVGATLTAGSNAALVVDGVTVTINQVILVKNQASAFQNGIYTVTTVGSGAAAWVLTRATYFDTAAEMLVGSYTAILAGATNLGSSWVLSATVATVGTTAATFNLYGTPLAPGTLLGSNNLDDVADVSLSRRNLGVPPFRLPVTPGQTLKAFGDSITVGTGASNTAVYGYIQRFAQYLKATLTNSAVAGTGSNSICYTSFSALAKYNRPRDVVTWMGSHNDIYRGGTNAKTISKLKGELRSFLANSFLMTAFPASDSSLTKTGTWSSGSGIREKAAASLAGSLRFSSTVNDTITGTFTGDNFVVGYFNSDGVSLHVGTFTVSIDSASSGPGFATVNGDALADGISDGVYDNKLTHDALVLTGLGVGSHTFTIKVTVAPSGAYPVYIDYVGTLNYPPSAGPVIVFESSRPNAAGYSLGGGVWSAAAFDLADAAINAVVAEFYNYPVTVAKVSYYQNTTTGIGVDNEHPNDLGHYQLEQAAREAIDVRQLYFVPGGRFSKSGNQSIATATYVSITFDQEAYDDYGLHDNVTNNTRFTAPNAGTFEFKGFLGFDVNATGQRFISYQVSGGTIVDVSCVNAATNSQTTIIPFSFEVDLAQGSFVEILGVQNSGGSLAVLAANTQLRVTQVR